MVFHCPYLAPVHCERRGVGRIVLVCGLRPSFAEQSSYTPSQLHSGLAIGQRTKKGRRKIERYFIRHCIAYAYHTIDYGRNCAGLGL